MTADTASRSASPTVAGAAGRYPARMDPDIEAALRRMIAAEADLLGAREGRDDLIAARLAAGERPVDIAANFRTAMDAIGLPEDQRAGLGAGESAIRAVQVARGLRARRPRGTQP